MTDIDPAAVKAAHHADGTFEPIECSGCRKDCMYCEGDHLWPCEPYLLADALLAALAATEKALQDSHTHAVRGDSGAILRDLLKLRAGTR